jgi:hypothetical protein
MTLFPYFFYPCFARIGTRQDAAVGKSGRGPEVFLSLLGGYNIEPEFELVQQGQELA